ncbi:hypothetical protein ACS0TY_013127 [Phlomoides rotata]
MDTLFHNTFVIVSIGILILMLNKRHRRMNYRRRKFTILDRIPAQMNNMSDLCEVSDEDCRSVTNGSCFIPQAVLPIWLNRVKELSRSVTLCVADVCYVLGQATIHERGQYISTLTTISGCLFNLI